MIHQPKDATTTVTIKTANVANVSRGERYAFSRDTLERLVAKGSVFGEILDANTERRLTIDVKEASHAFENLRMVGDSLVGDLRTRNTPTGRILQEIMSAVPEQIAYSIRGISKSIVDGLIDMAEVVAIDISYVPPPQKKH